MDTTNSLCDTTDATIWAHEFCKLWPSALCQIPGKEGVSQGEDFEATMVGWFANAIMAGVDSEARKRGDRKKASMAEIIPLPAVTRLDIDPDRILNAAVGECDSVVIIGYDKDGDEYFASSIADGGTVLWLIERMKKQLLDVPDQDQ